MSSVMDNVVMGLCGSGDLRRGVKPKSWIDRHWNSSLRAGLGGAVLGELAPSHRRSHTGIGKAVSDQDYCSAKFQAPDSRKGPPSWFKLQLGGLGEICVVYLAHSCCSSWTLSL